MWIIVGSALALLAGAAAAQDCSPGAIGVERVHSRVDGDYVYITGKLINKCAIATGVQIKVTFYDKTGDVLTVHDTWPNSINNIPPGDFPFQDMMRRVPGMAKFDVRVIETKVWRRP